MRPTTPELIAAIIDSLEQQVAPHVQDKWAASALRSAAQLLRHLALRTERESAVLIEDNIDVRRVLEIVRPHLGGRPPLAAAEAAVVRALSDAEPDAHDVADLDARNESYQHAVGQLLADPAVRAESGTVEILRGYLHRRLEREHALYFPVFTAPPF
jgi:hypothetical protein